MSEAAFLAVNKVRLRHLMQRGSVPAKAVYQLLTGLDRLILQAAFTEGGAAPAEIKNWIKKVGEIRPREVHLGSLDGKAGKGPSASRLEKIAAELVETTGVPAHVFAAEAVPV